MKTTECHRFGVSAKNRGIALVATLTLSGMLVSMETVPLAAAEAPRGRMNVLLLIADDMRADLGSYGSSIARTPNLDQLAKSGTRFHNAYCQFPLCNPSRSSMLTGRYPTATGVLGNRTWFRDQHPEMISLPGHFKAHGYTTIAQGKIFHGGIDDTSSWSIGGKKRVLAGVDPDDRPSPPAPEPNDPKSPGLSKDQRSDRWVMLDGMGESHGDFKVTDRTITALRAPHDQPFFLACGLVKPHSPPEAPKVFFEKWDLPGIPLPVDFAPRPTVPAGFPAGCIRSRNADLFIGRDATPDLAREMIRAYHASAAWMDWNMGRILDALDESGLRDSTIVVFWGDHGYQLGEKGKWSKAGSLWEEGTRVPLIIRDPRRPAGQSSLRVVEMVDLFPTLTELCGLPTPAGLDGKSLSPLLENPAAPWDKPAYSVWSEDGKTLSGVAVRDERWRYA